MDVTDKKYSAKGDGLTDDTVAINNAISDAVAAESDVFFPSGTYLISGTVTAGARFTFAEGARIKSLSKHVLQLDKGYQAGPYQVFDSSITVRIRYWTTDVLYFEHFGAKVLNDPRGGASDSTGAIRTLFESLQGAIYPPDSTTKTPGVYNAFTVHLLGIYGISDEIKVNPGGYRVVGHGVGLTGTGFKWVGEEKPENHSKAMLRLFAPQWAEIDGLIFLGPPTHKDANRLYAGIALQSAGTVPLPFYPEQGRRTTIRRCTFSDTVGYFNRAEDCQFQHGIITDGKNGNDDFHVFDTCVIANAEFGITIGNSQNVDVQIRNCAVGVVKTAGVWHRNGGELFIDGLYVYRLRPGASYFKVGPPDPEQGIPNCRITMRLVGGENNKEAASFVHNAFDHRTGLFWDLTRCEIYLNRSDTPFLSGDACAYMMTLNNCDITGTFKLSVGESTKTDASLRNMLTFHGCRNLQNVKVQNTTTNALLDVEVVNSMGEAFESAPHLLLRDKGRRVGGISYRKRFSKLNADVAIALDDPSLYAATSTLCDRVGVGNANFGFESELGYKTYLFNTKKQFTLTFAGALPARSVVFGCQIANLEANFLANSNDPGAARIYVGDTTDYKRYGFLPGSAGFQASAVTDSFAPFVTAVARDVVLRGAWEPTGATWNWSGTTISITLGHFNADMLGNEILFTTGPLAGKKTVVKKYIDATHLQVADNNSGSGEALMWVPFAGDKRLLFAPAYYQMMSNSALIKNDARLNLLYAEQVTPT